MARIPLGVSDWRRGLAQSPFVRLRNRYFETDPSNLETATSLLARPGLKRWLLVGGGPNRGGPYSQPGSFDDALFVVSGTELYRIDTDENVTLLETGLFDNDTTRASMAATAAIGTTPERLFIADGVVLRMYSPDTYATGELLASGSIAAADVVRIGGVYYSFTAGSVDAGTPGGTAGNPWLVALGADKRAALANLKAAVNATGIPGATYSTALVVNASAEARSSSADTLFATARAIGVTGNSVVTTTTITGGAWLAGTLTGGAAAAVTLVDVPDGLKPISLAFIAGYVIVVPAPERGYKGRFYWIEPADTTILVNNFATAERSADPLVSVRVFGDQFALFGTEGPEMWYPTGDVLAPFVSSQGRVFSMGLWEGSDVQIKDTLIFMDPNGRVYRVDGGGAPTPISDPSVEERTRNAIKLATTQVGPDPDPGGGPLSATLLTAGQTLSSSNTFTSFAPMLAEASGGVGPYQYRFFWQNRVDGNFGFAGANTQALVTPQVVSVGALTTATAQLVCEVTDARGTRVQSSPASYSFMNTLPVDATPPPAVPTLTVQLNTTVFAGSGENQTQRTFGPAIATIVGGVGPFTYAWYFESTFEGSWALTAPSSATTNLRVTGVQVAISASAVLRCRVSDSTGAFGISPQLFAYQTNRLPPGSFIP